MREIYADKSLIFIIFQNCRYDSKRKQPPQNKQNFFPLGAPPRPPVKPSRPARPEADTAEAGAGGSFFDFLPFFGPSKEQAAVQPRRPPGPPPSHRVTQLDHHPDYPAGLQAPLLLKVTRVVDIESWS